MRRAHRLAGTGAAVRASGQDFITRSVEDQVTLLVIGDTPANGQEKCLAYARLLAEAGITYQAKGQTALALGAYRFALMYCC